VSFNKFRSCDFSKTNSTRSLDFSHPASKIFYYYLKFIGLCYLVGFLLHALDLLHLRLEFSRMKPFFKLWIVYLFLADGFSVYGLFKSKIYGEVLFLIIAISQMIAYIFFKHYFGAQDFLIGFHLTTVLLYAGLLYSAQTNSSIHRWFL